MELHILGFALENADAMTAQSAQSDSNAQHPTIQTTISVPANLMFPTALKQAMHSGARITRAGWNAAGQWVAAQRPDAHSKMSAPYLYLKNAQGRLVPWLPSQGDLFAEDWAVLPA